MQSILFLTRRCNLRCDYCYQFGRIPHAMHGGGPEPMDMPMERVLQAISWTLGRSLEEKKAGFGLFGGEPFLVRKSLYGAVGYAEELAQKMGIDVGFSTSTNGTLITTADARFLTYHRFLVQLSLDGVPVAHNLHRRFPDGRPSVSLAVQALNRLLEAGAFVEVSSVVSPDTVPFLPESFRFLTRILGVRRMNIALSVTHTWEPSDMQALEASLRETAEELIRLYRDDVDVVVDLFDEPIESYIRGYYPHQYCPFGLGKVAVDIDGTLYPCDRVSGDGSRSDVVIGSLSTGIDTERLDDLRFRVGQTKSPCPVCPIAERCRHWCGCINRDASGDVGEVSSTFCDLQRIRVRVADEMAETLYNEGNPLFLTRFYDG